MDLYCFYLQTPQLVDENSDSLARLYYGKEHILTILGFTGMNTYIHLKQPTEAETSASLYLLALIVSFF